MSSFNRARVEGLENDILYQAIDCQNDRLLIIQVTTSWFCWSNVGMLCQHIYKFINWRFFSLNNLWTQKFGLGWAFPSSCPRSRPLDRTRVLALALNLFQVWESSLLSTWFILGGIALAGAQDGYVWSMRGLSGFGGELHLSQMILRSFCKVKRIHLCVQMINVLILLTKRNFCQDKGLLTVSCRQHHLLIESEVFQWELWGWWSLFVVPDDMASWQKLRSLCRTWSSLTEMILLGSHIIISSLL